MNSQIAVAVILIASTVMVLGTSSLIFFAANELTLKRPKQVLKSFKANPWTALSYCALALGCLITLI